MTGTVDPSSTATSAVKGSLYINSSNGNTYQKTDNGSSTNWTVVGSGSVGSTRVRSTRFVSIGAGTSGTVTLPSNSTVVLDDFGGTVDAVVTQMSGGKPTQSHALTSTGSVVATTFDSSGNWAFSAAPVAYPVGIIYRVYQTLTAFDSTSADIWGDTAVDTAATGQLGITIDGGGSVITTGLKGFLTVPYDCTIVSATMAADVSGSCVIDVWNRAYASFPPTVTQSIVASAPPTLSSQQSSQDTTLTGWTSSGALLAGSVLAFNVNSASTVTRVTLTLKVTK